MTTLAISPSTASKRDISSCPINAAPNILVNTTGRRRTGMKDESAQRLEKIESHLAHLERHYEQLNEVVVEQAKLIQRLVAQQKKIVGALETAELERIKSTNPKPPHYQ